VESLTPSVVENDAGEVIESEQRVNVRLRFQVVAVLGVVLVEFGQQGGIGRLRELGFFVDQSKDVHRLHGDHVQRLLVVDELDPTPVDCFVVVLLLQTATRHQSAVVNNSSGVEMSAWVKK